MQERGLWQEGLVADCQKCKEKKGDDAEVVECCARRILANQPDFQAQRGLIQEELEKRVHKVIFYPKFYPELNYIEMYWGAAKAYARQNCDYSWTGLRRVVPEALDSVPVERIRAYARQSFRWMDAYRHGLTEAAAKYAIRKQKSHRKLNEGITNML